MCRVDNREHLIEIAAPDHEPKWFAEIDDEFPTDWIGEQCHH
jgi:hypothetical protein